MSDSDVMMLKGELDTLKAVMTERWASHDKRSDERWTDLMEQFHEMVKKLDGRPCSEHSALMLDMTSRMKRIEKDAEGQVVETEKLKKIQSDRDKTSGDQDKRLEVLEKASDTQNARMWAVILVVIGAVVTAVVEWLRK